MEKKKATFLIDAKIMKKIREEAPKITLEGITWTMKLRRHHNAKRNSEVVQ